MGRVNKQWDGINNQGATIAAEGTSVGNWLDFSRVTSALSLIYYDPAGVSTSQDISYEIGYVRKGVTVKNHDDPTELDAKVNAVLPADAGAIGANVDLNAASNNAVHDTLTLPAGIYFRFTWQNDSGMGDATPHLYIMAEVSQR